MDTPENPQRSDQQVIADAHRDRLHHGLRTLASWCEVRLNGCHDTEATLTKLEKKVGELRLKMMKAGWAALKEREKAAKMSKETETKLPVEQAQLVKSTRGDVPRCPIPGWQWVECDDCGTTWKESTRDVISPSHVDCPNHCDHGGDTHVWKYERDETLPRDPSGNLLNSEVIVLTRGLGHNADVEAPK